MPPRRRGRPPKPYRNLVGLRNQPQAPTSPPQAVSDPEDDSNPSPTKRSRINSPELSSDNDDSDYDEWFAQAIEHTSGMDGTKEHGEQFADEEDNDLDDLELPADLNWEMEDEDTFDNLVDMAEEAGDDPQDEEWLPDCVRRQKLYKEAEKKVRVKTYSVGPVIANKSPRTQRRYRKAMEGQRSLTNFGFFVASKPDSPLGGGDFMPANDPSQSLHNKTPPPSQEADLLDSGEAHSPITSPTEDSLYGEEVHRPVTSPPTESGLDSDGEGMVDPTAGMNDDMDDMDEDVWMLEAEIARCQNVKDTAPDIRGWEELCAQIKDDLKKNYKSLSLSQVNKYLILRNFATLRLKGYGKMAASEELAKQWHEGEGKHFSCQIRKLARHYQIHEQLPLEQRGGVRAKSRSLLMDEVVQTAARSWLMGQKSGEVTPICFQNALNDEILPSIGVVPKKPLCNRTARRWLVRLGWRRTLLRKGVYMDGHEREDVQEYRDKVFLPKMKDFENRMTKYDMVVVEGKMEIKETAPTLAEDEKEIIAIFQDESCFHC